jgi:peptide/nickel transport system ATP-binding protein
VTVAALRQPVLETAVAPVLEVADLHIDRVRPGGTDTIVSSVSLSLGAGETIGIVGESGSGKSMTARAITGLLPPALVARGEIRYGGRDLLQLRERQWRAIRGRKIGLVLQDTFTMLNPVMRCGRILQESMLNEPRLSRAQKKAEAVRRLAEVGIHDSSVVDRYPFELSGGMRQRVAIAASLARDPNVLIADEPST